jgi:hypothetical protein
MGKLFWPTVLVTIVALAGIGSVPFAQGTGPLDGSAQDALIAEVRALRAEINQVAGAGIRMQLLVARLQLQEQRVFTVARHLTDAQNALAASRARLAGEQARVRQLEEAASRASGQSLMTFQQAILEAAPQIEQQQRQELGLKARETELLRSVHDAQALWMDFNNRLDALEQSLH